jgi:hypothetical protein
MNQNLLCLKFLFFTSVVSISSLSLLAQESKTIKTFAESSFLNQPKVRAHFGWGSKYVLEGREALGGASILSSSVEASYDHVFGGVWYGRSSSNDFRELHLGLGLKQETGHFEYYLAYTHLLFPVEETSDSEWGTGISYDALPFGMETGLDLVYSADAKGTFIEWSLSKSFEVLHS